MKSYFWEEESKDEGYAGTGGLSSSTAGEGCATQAWRNKQHSRGGLCHTNLDYNSKKIADPKVRDLQLSY